MKKTKFKKNNSKQKGFVLLFAVLISTLVLSVGISMISIALRQVVLSGSGRDSQYAFYVANTGAECATYWDLASSSVFTSLIKIPDEGVACLNNPIAGKFYPDSDGIFKNLGDEIEINNTCEGVSGVLSDPDWCFDGNTNIGGTSYAKFRIAYSDKPYCADVIVKKEWVGDGAPTPGSIVSKTTVTSRGYNTCDTTNPRRIERALEFSY